MSKVATRFAPSPTGALHIGGVRTALFNWLYSKNQNGTFHLRIEDTDKERSKDEHKIQIIKSLKWIGIEHDGELYIQSSKIKSSIVMLFTLTSPCTKSVNIEDPSILLLNLTTGLMSFGALLSFNSLHFLLYV